MKGRRRKQTLPLLKTRVAIVMKNYGVKRAGIAGSYARGEETWMSDLDVVVEVPDDWSLLDFVSLRIAIEDAVGLRVDLVEYVALRSRIREGVMRDEVVVL